GSASALQVLASTTRIATARTRRRSRRSRDMAGSFLVSSLDRVHEGDRGPLVPDDEGHALLEVQLDGRLGVGAVADREVLTADQLVVPAPQADDRGAVDRGGPGD